jgi:hypothetical protein
LLLEIRCRWVLSKVCFALGHRDPLRLLEIDTARHELVHNALEIGSCGVKFLVGIDALIIDEIGALEELLDGGNTLVELTHRLVIHLRVALIRCRAGLWLLLLILLIQLLSLGLRLGLSLGELHLVLLQLRLHLLLLLRCKRSGSLVRMSSWGFEYERESFLHVGRSED